MGYFMFGLPGETYETARRTIQTLKSLPYDTIGCFFAVPLPGSNWWYEWCKDRELSEIDYTQFHYIEFKIK